MSVPTKEVRNNLDRNPGSRSLGGIAPPLDIALSSMQNPQSQCVRTSYAWIRSVGRKNHQYILPVESHGERSLVDGSLHCVLEHLGADEGAGGVEHLDFTAQDIARCIHT